MKDQPQKITLKNQDCEPVFRIGVIEGQEYIDFRVEGKFSILDENENPIINNITSSIKWRVKIKESKAGTEHYQLILCESFNWNKIQEKLEIAQKIDLEVEIMVLGGDVYLCDKKINNNTKYALVCGSYSTNIEAKKACKHFQPAFNPTVIKKTIKKPKGILEFFDAEYDFSGEAKNAFKIVPEKVDYKTHLYNIRSYNEVLQKESFEDRVYNGTMEFRIDNQGKVMVISEIPLESYLKRVVFSESGRDLPVEFSKSLAIVCRSEVLARIAHKHLWDSYDMCDWGHCLRYYGKDFNDENISIAVEETRGQVIFSGDNICDAYFNLICGGHTEDATGVWEIEESTQFIGKYDWKQEHKEYGSLRDEKSMRKWLLSRPDAWCNLRGRKVPPSLEQYKKYFRWEVEYTRKELEDILKTKTGEDIGILFDIIPIHRGRSGRLKEIELIGSLKNHRIRGELNIRESLSHDYLESSGFMIEKELDEIGTPISFTLVGAGQGHGVGMCKTGAAIMALEGKDVKTILKHYFENCKIHTIYQL
jgi:stage II sporulation protein D